MTIDPFATAPAFDAAPTDVMQSPDAPAVGSVWVDVKPRVQTVEVESKISLTFKGGTGFDAPWIVVHATGLDDALSYVSGEGAGKLQDLMNRVQNAGKAFSSQGTPTVNNSVRMNAPQAATEAPAWAPAKPHADFVYKSGVSKKNGKVWHAWMPPQQGDSREPLFFYAP